MVGAGPTGLLLACELERRDVSCLLVDALDVPQGWDRATVVHERSLEILEALGIADRLLDVAAQLGVADVTLLAIRPDRYIGLRDDTGDPTGAVEEYLNALVA